MVDANGNTLQVGDKVLVVGTITDLADGIHPVALLNAQQQGQVLSFTYYTADLRKATEDGSTIFGDVNGPGK